ncbi:ninein (predicted), isoform CRA_b [Rattus norvegicus]|uniref:Ninein (Predicted), isoform CRA_b n=1 Tax=Rattus norvegicus TaxID=10116 RepID=A6HBY5_RAT|nr:ninein (predicted), isoform CRA_b [Rattus norvegicus]
MYTHTVHRHELGHVGIKCSFKLFDCYFTAKAFTVLFLLYADVKDFVNQSQTSACYKSAYLYGLKSGFKILESIYSIYFLIPYDVIIFKRRYYFYIWNLKKIRVIYTVFV